MADEPKEKGGKHAKNGDIKRNKPVADGEIEALRTRLYARGADSEYSTRHTLTKETPVEAPHEPPAHQTLVREPMPERPSSEETISSEMGYSEHMATKKRSSYRKYVAIFGLAFFVVAVGIASMLMFWGNNTISGSNISLETNGPISVGGGEELSFQVVISNQNTVPIRSATLIIEYPEGTKSAAERDRELTVERIQLDTIGAGELVNIPLKAVVYGEEDEEKEIDVRIEYRVEGSNATFEKRSEPFEFQISTSPVVMTLDAVERISSGQELALTITVQSNSPTPLTNILVKAQYPVGFEYRTSEPDTISGQDTWRIEELKPNEQKTIAITGIVTGGENEIRTFDVTAGVGRERDPNTLGSQLAAVRTEVIIEQPFLDVNMQINGSPQETVVVNEKSAVNVGISFTNTLDTAIYDGRVYVELGGNALNEFEVDGARGFYDSTSNTIVWDATGVSSLEEVLPGQKVSLNFRLSPDSNVGSAPELNIKVTLTGERQVFTTNTPQELVGIIYRTVKVESVPEIDAEILHDVGPFTNSGPLPPVAEEVTQYTYRLSVEAGVNDLTDTELTAVLPQYVSWLDLTQGDGSASYNATTRTLKWSIGDMDSSEVKTLYAQVALRPSLTQVGTVPTLLGSQQLRATDRFTGTTVRADSPALTTRNESEDELEDGRVRESN